MGKGIAREEISIKSNADDSRCSWNNDGGKDRGVPWAKRFSLYNYLRVAGIEHNGLAIDREVFDVIKACHFEERLGEFKYSRRSL